MSKNLLARTGFGLLPADINEHWLSAESTPGERLSLASALHDYLPKQRLAVLQRLLKFADDSYDHNLPLMYWYALEPLVDRAPAQAI